MQARGVPRDRFFGRDEVLKELHGRLQRSDRVAIASVAGMGGVGKSELALQYARQHLHETYRGGVVWLPGERAGIELLGFAKSRFFPNQDFSKIGDLPEQLAHCFTNWPVPEIPPESVLLIFDDVTDYRAQVEAILPSDLRFRVLITTRAKFQGIERLDLDVLTDEAALQLLESIVGPERIAAERETAAALCKWLGFLPLGIELVGSLLRVEPDWSIQSVLEQLKREKLRHEAMGKVEIAFNISWQQLAPSPQQLAVLLGCFGNGAIPWELVEATVARCEATPCRKRKLDGLWQWMTRKPATQPEQWCLLLNRDQLTQARRRLVELSLLERTGPEEYKLHPLIREFFAAKRATWPEGKALQQAFWVQMVSVAETVPYGVTLSDLDRTRPAWPHLETAAAAAASDEIAGAAHSTIFLFVALAWLAEGQGLWAVAEQHHTTCLAVIATRFGTDHPSTAASLGNLANLYESQGRYGEAEPLYRRSLEIYERVLGAEHPATAQNLNNLAHLYQRQGRYKEAESLHRRALAIREQVLGADHPDTAQSLSNLAALYDSQDRYGEAEPLLLRSLAIREQVLRADHPDTAISLNNLAELYKSQRRHEEAELLLLRSLAIREQVLGADHPDTAVSLNNLANLYQSQGRYGEAEPLYRRALAIHEQVLGANHPDTAISLNNLANLYQSQGRYGEAEPLYRRALAIHEQVLGADHPKTATSLNNLAGLYQSQGRYGEAEPLYRRSLAICEKVLGADHPSTAQSVHDLAVLYYYQNRWCEAELLLMIALESRVRRLGEAHPKTQDSLRSLFNLIGRAFQSNHAAELSNHPLTQSILTKLQTIQGN